MDAIFLIDKDAKKADDSLDSVLDSLPLDFDLDSRGNADIDNHMMQFSVEYDPEAPSDNGKTFLVKPLPIGNVTNIARYRARTGELNYHDSSSSEVAVSHRGRTFVFHYKLRE